MNYEELKNLMLEMEDDMKNALEWLKGADEKSVEGMEMLKNLAVNDSITSEQADEIFEIAQRTEECMEAIRELV